jgi:hypothetical protein
MKEMTTRSTMNAIRSPWWRGAALGVAALFMTITTTAQTITIGTGTTTTSGTDIYVPIYQSSSSSGFLWSRSGHLLLPAQLSSIPVGATITSIAFYKATTSTLNTGRSAVFTIYMKNSAMTTLPSGVAFNTRISGATNVYSVTQTPANVPNTEGYWTWTLTTPFVYTGGAIEVYTDFVPNSGTSGLFTAGNTSSNLRWRYNSTSVNQVGGDNNNSAAAIAGTTFAGVTTRQIHTQITYTVPPCIGTVSVTPSSPVSCVGQGGVSLAASSTRNGVSYTWSPATGLSSTTGATVTANPSSTTTYTVSALDDEACTDTKEVTVTVASAPLTPTITPGSANFCVGGSTGLTALSTFNASVTSGGGAESSSTGNSPYRGFFPTSRTQNLYLASELTAMGLAVGDTIKSLTTRVVASSATNLGGFQISMKETAATSFTSGFSMDGAGLTTVFGPVTYAQPTSSNYDVVHNLSNAFVWQGGNLLVQFCHASSSAQSAATTATVVQNTTATNLATGNTNGCTATNTATATTARLRITFGYGRPVTYAWSPATGLSATTGASVTANPTTTQTYTVGATAGGCTASNTVTVTVDQLPTASAGGSQNICQNGTATVSGASSSNGSILWTHNGAGSLDDATTLTPTYNAAAGDAGNTVTLTMTVTSTNLCNPANAQATYTVNVSPFNTASAGGSQAICETGTATVSGASASGGSILWTTGNPGSLSDETTLTPTYTPDDAYPDLEVTLTMTVSNAGCPDATANYTVNVQPLPNASAGGSTAICVDGSATVTGATASNGSILWTSDGAGSFDDDTDLLPTYTPDAADAGSDVVLTMTVTSNNACAGADDDAIFTVTVNPLPVVDAGSYFTLCSVDADLTLVGAPLGGTWSGTGVTGDQFDPSVGTQILTYEYTDGNSCTNSDDVTITVTPATTWYADQDGDGFGDPNTTQDACDQPSGYVSNNTDNCPTVFGLQGDFCDADPDPNTFALGVLDSNCACILLPPDLDVTMELRTPDGSSDNITWELVTNVGSQVVCSGGGYPSGITDPITAFCSIPNGCYRLRVQDESGDGVGFGPGGGYQLRLAGPNAQDIRIVDNLGNFSSGVLSAIGNGPAAICFPMASDPKPLYQHRDKLDFVSGQYLISEEDAAVSAVWNPAPNAVQSTNTGYEFWLFDPNGSYSYRRFRNHATSDGFGNVGATRACHMKVNGWFASQAAPANVLLNVRIRTRVNGVNGDWGPAYRFKIDPARAACPLTLLNDFPGNAFESCGQTRTWGGSTLIHARPVSGANRYQWRFRTVGEPLAPIIIRTSNTYFLTLNWTVNPLQPGKTYEVDVRASKTAGATWCTDAVLPALVDPWGTVCLLTIQGSNAQGGGQNLALENSNTNLSLYPNPNRGDQVMLSIDLVDEGVETISIDFFDLAGHRAVARTIPTQGNNLNSLLELNGLAAGVYIVHITAGDKVYTERLVVTQ